MAGHFVKVVTCKQIITEVVKLLKLEWHNEKRKLKDLIPYESNPRRLTDKQHKDLTKSLTKFNLAEVPAIDTDNKIIAGHQRVKILSEIEGVNFEVDVRVPNRKLTEKEFQEYNIRSNKNAGEFDFDILANEFELPELLEWGFEEKELDLNLWNEIDETKLDEVPEVPKVAVSKLGDLFEIDGKHRVMCGDSTKAEDVEKLMDGQKADMVFTDPPYNVDYEGYTKDKLTIGNDAMGCKEYEDFLTDVFLNYRKFSKDGCGFYICHASAWQNLTENCMNKAGIIMRNQIIWAKNTFAWGMGRYKFQHEPIFYAYVKGKSDGWYGDKSQSTLWEVNKPSRSEEHPTMKPIELINKALSNSSKMGDVVSDLFLGSGSTLIACQQTNRKCFGMEIDPVYIDVILKRYKKLYPDSTFKCLNRKYDYDKLFSEL